MVYCCVDGCSNARLKPRKVDDVSFYRFPMDPEQKKNWLNAIGRPDWDPPKNASVCSNHFGPEHLTRVSTSYGIQYRLINAHTVCPVKVLPPRVCRICLATDVKMYSLQHGKLKCYMDTLVKSIENFFVEGLPRFACYECVSYIPKCYTFIKKSALTQDILLHMLDQYGEINKPQIIKSRAECYMKLKSSLDFCRESPSCLCHNSGDTYVYTIEECKKQEIDFEIVNIPEIQLDVTKESKEENNDNEVLVKEEPCDIDKEQTVFEKEDSDSEVSVKVEDDDYEDFEAEIDDDDDDKPKKAKRRKAVTDISSGEINMEKHFNIVKIPTLKQQIEEWNKWIENAARRRRGKLHKCEVCCKLFKHARSCELHEAFHSPTLERQAQCPVCKIFFKNDSAVKSHINYVHRRRYHCRACTKVYTSVSAAKTHLKSHSAPTALHKCPRCPYTASHIATIRTHVLREHAHAHACEICGRSCVSQRSLYLHRSFAHRGYKAPVDGVRYPCETCNLTFTSENARLVHLATSKQHRVVDTKPKAALKCKCSSCGDEFPSKRKLVAHLRTEHSSRSQPQRRTPKPGPSYPKDCELCNVTMKTRREHYFHVRRWHPKEQTSYEPTAKVICDTCGKGFSSKAHLKYHELRHGAPQCRCDVCGKMFFDKYALADHSSMHSSDQPFVCNVCSRAFNRKSNLVRHMLIHTGETPYDCTICGKKFRQASVMRLHVRTVHYKMPHPPRKKRKPRGARNVTADTDNVT